MEVSILCMGYGPGMFSPRLHLPCVPLKVKAVANGHTSELYCLGPNWTNCEPQGMLRGVLGAFLCKEKPICFPETVILRSK